MFLDGISEDEFIIEQQSKCVSPNEIRATLQTLLRITRSSNRIRKELFKHYEKIKQINKKFDKIACKKVHLLSMDETFKGRKIIILVLIDAITGYIICIKKIKNRKENTIVKALEPYKKLLTQVDLVLTDGAPYFPKVINRFLPNVRHQICLVHVLRNLFRKMEPYQRAYKKAQRKVKVIKKKIEKKKSLSENRRYELKKYKQKDRYWKNKRNVLRKKYGIRPYQKGSLKKYPVLREINLKINFLRVNIGQMSNTVANDKYIIANLDYDLYFLGEIRDLKWGDYMKQYRMLYKFYNIFWFHSSKYHIARSNLISLLTHSSVSDFYDEILRVLKKSKNLDTVNMDDCPVRLRRNFINTNPVESINAKLRPLFDRLKKIGDTEYMRAIFDLIKLRLNTTRPFSGIRKNTSPIERYGYKLKGRTFIDLIFRGLPSGPQYGLFSSQIDLTVANPNMVGKVKIPMIQ